MKRRDFVKTMAHVGRWRSPRAIVIADLHRSDAAGQGARVEVQGSVGHRARRRRSGCGCTYADIRFTRSTQQRRQRQRRQPRLRGLRRIRRRRARRRRRRRARRRWRLRRRRRGGGGTRRGGLRRARDPQRRLGLREQPDRHRGRDPAHHAHGDRGRQGERDRQAGGRQARAGAGVHRSTGRRRMQKDPATVSQEEKQALVQKVVDVVVKTKEVTNVNASVQLEHEWKYFASSEGSYIEQEIWSRRPRRSP